MTGARRHLVAAVAVAAALAVGATGCGQLDHRTGPRTMSQAMSKAFKRASAAAYRMTTGHADRDIVRHARATCRPRTPEPASDDTDWSWFCKLLWYRKQRADAHLATYGVFVDGRGCFQAVSGNFPSHLHERVLHRREENPLVYIRSCP